MNARVTLIGMEQTLNNEEKSINDSFNLLPSEMDLSEYDKDVLLAEIMRKGGTFEPLYTDPEYFAWDCSMWWKKWRRTFTKWWEAFQIEYHPLENYDRHELEHNDTVETGTLAQATHNQEVMDDDTSRNYQLDGTKTTENDGTSANTEVVDGETARTTSNTEVVDGETTGTKKTTTADDLATTKNTTSTETIDNDTTKNGTSSKTGTKTNNGGYNTNLSVAGFNSASLEPKSGETNTHNDTDNTTESGTTSETGTDDTETKRTESETGAENRDIETNETSASTEDRTTTNNGSENATEDRTTTNNGTTHNEGSETSKDEYGETGTDDRTTTNNGSLNQSTNNDRDYDHQSHIWGNIGVTTSQQMLESELKIQAWNIYEHMSDLFVNEMCVRVY